MPRTRDCRRPGRRAFTLLELMVVLFILAIAAAIIIPQAVQTSSLQAQQAARVLVADLEYAQNQAIVSQGDVWVAFNVAGKSYRLSNASGDLTHPITKKRPYEVDFDTYAGLSGVSIVSASFSGTTVLTFNALGAPNYAGTVTVAAGSYTYRVAVAPVTGRVSVTSGP